MTASCRPPDATAPFRNRHSAAGFTLIELVLVLLLIGILSTLAIYVYQALVNKARMTQAKTVLSHLARTEAVYFSSNDRYTDNVALLDFDPVRYPFYTVEVVLDNGGRNFTGYARGIGPMVGDLWHVTRDGDPTQDNASPFR